jgi:hypothetical protein
MQEVRVIARAVAQQGKGDQLKVLLRGLVQPTRAEAGCKYYELFESNLAGYSYSTSYGRAKSISMLTRQAIILRRYSAKLRHYWRSHWKCIF